MRHSRRQILVKSVSGGMAAIVTAVLPTAEAAGSAATPLIQSSPAPAPLAVILLNRAGFGPRPGDIAAFNALGRTDAARLVAYVDQQLQPSDDDPAYVAARGRARLSVRYGLGSNRVDELRPFSRIDQDRAELWALSRNRDLDFVERDLPLREVRADTWLRAVYSRWQLREVLIDFWHNHFNVRATTNDQVRATWPLYDRIFRSGALGNFRAMLEQVAKSIAMNYYLNNQENRGTGFNENYARELFELHTLGADHYLNNLYDNWEAVPGAKESPPRPVGYIDQDVYEAARAFTGWKIADGARVGATALPDTGEFTYVSASTWFDRAQKRVLGVQLNNDLTPEQYGQAVLDLTAFHPGTARYVCTKLCQRLVADTPPQRLVDAAVQTWMASQREPDQIARVVRTILLAPEFAATWGQKVKRPFELVASFIRATDMAFPPRDIFDGSLLSTTYWNPSGWFPFEWAPPTGHPDEAEYWLGTSATLRRWSTLNDLLGRGFWALPADAPLPLDIQAATPADRRTSRQIAAYWAERLLGRPIDATSLETLATFMAQNSDPSTEPSGANLAERYLYLVSLVAMTTDFQWR